MMLRIKSNSSARRGSSLVEFALVSFQLLLVMFAVFEFARMGLVYTDLASASRIAARYAITHGIDRSLVCCTGGADGMATTGDICGASGVLTTFATALNKANLNCTVTGVGGGVGSTVKVTVTYPYDPWVLLPLTVTLSSTSQGIITY
ncbi:MAG: pilus assembly protein [Acidobacteria bacterium]|nr:pilus assembly protein [Acidobacteriota bacterium]